MLSDLLDRIAATDFTSRYGKVRAIAPSVIEATGPAGMLGELCSVAIQAGGETLAQIVAADEQRVLLSPLDGTDRIALGARVTARTERDRVAVGDGFAGRLVNALGLPLDGGEFVKPDCLRPLDGEVPRPLDRVSPDQVLETGIRAIDGLLPLGQGQRVGIFAASGVGKTSLVEQLARQIKSDRVVICLVGERGREVEGFWRLLAARDDARRFTLVAATSDESAALRARSVSLALALAEYWRGKGDHVLVLIDSVTRLAMALRELGLAAGSPPTVRAYTPNIFSALPRVVERCGGVRGGGAITAIMAVLSETDDVDDPIVELMKSLLDGHILLSRTLAEQGHFPAIDIPRSVSRGAHQRTTLQHQAMISAAQSMLSAYESSRVMIESGIYRAGSNKLTDRAIARRERLIDYLQQPSDQRIDSVRSVTALSFVGDEHG